LAVEAGISNATVPLWLQTFTVQPGSRSMAAPRHPDGYKLRPIDPLSKRLATNGHPDLFEREKVRRARFPEAIWRTFAGLLPMRGRWVSLARRPPGTHGQQDRERDEGGEPGDAGHQVQGPGKILVKGVRSI
jgi:hypothetical protein